MPSRVVRPETDKLPISDGDWVLVKRRLNHGETQKMFARRYLSDAFGNRVNLELAGMEKVTAYLLDWSLTDLEDKPLVIRDKSIDEVESAINAIDPESFAEIRAAIDAHELAQAIKRAEEKKLRAGAHASSPTSPSPSAVDGGSTGSGS
jgi:hypothetical protein